MADEFEIALDPENEDLLQKIADTLFSGVESLRNDVIAGIFISKSGCVRLRITQGADHSYLRRVLKDLVDDFWIDARHIPRGRNLN